MDDVRQSVFEHISRERDRQLEMWPREHDLNNDRAQWLAIILQEAHGIGFQDMTEAQVIRSLEKTAAVCVAALELHEGFRREREAYEDRRLKETMAAEEAKRKALEDFKDKPFPDAPSE